MSRAAGQAIEDAEAEELLFIVILIVSHSSWRAWIAGCRPDKTKGGTPSMPVGRSIRAPGRRALKTQCPMDMVNDS